MSANGASLLGWSEWSGEWLSSAIAFPMSCGGAGQSRAPDHDVEQFNVKKGEKSRCSCGVPSYDDICGDEEEKMIPMVTIQALPSCSLGYNGNTAGQLPTSANLERCLAAIERFENEADQKGKVALQRSFDLRLCEKMDQAKAETYLAQHLPSSTRGDTADPWSDADASVLSPRSESTFRKLPSLWVEENDAFHVKDLEDGVKMHSPAFPEQHCAEEEDSFQIKDANDFPEQECVEGGDQSKIDIWDLASTCARDTSTASSPPNTTGQSVAKDVPVASDAVGTSMSLPGNNLATSRDSSGSNVTSPRRSIALGAGVGAVATGTGGGAVGAAAGLPFALFTFGLSVPIGAAVGAGIGGIGGAVSGGVVGHVVHKRSVGKLKNTEVAEARMSEPAEEPPPESSDQPNALCDWEPPVPV